MPLSPYSISFDCHGSIPNCSALRQPTHTLQPFSSPGLCTLQDGYLGQCQALRRGTPLCFFPEPNSSVDACLVSSQNNLRYSTSLLLRARNTCTMQVDEKLANAKPLLHIFTANLEGVNTARIPFPWERARFEHFAASPPYALGTILGPFCQMCSSYFCPHRPHLVVQNSKLAYQYPSCDIAKAVGPETTDRPDYGSFLDILIVSHNISSFKSNSGPNPTHSGHSKLPSTLADLLSRKVHIAGYQEARLDGASHHNAHFMIFSTEPVHATNGSKSLGVALIISRCIPFEITVNGRQRSIYIGPESVTECIKNPRYLLVLVETSSVKFFIFVLHAPDSLSKHKMKAWWSSMSDEIWDIVGTHTPMFLCADCNAKVGSCASPYIGSFHRDTENYPGEMFHNFLRRFSLFLPHTFGHFCTGENRYTFKHSSGSFHRIDYIGIPSTYVSRNTQAYVVDVLEEIGSSMHSAIAVSTSACMAESTRPIWRKVNYDKNADFSQQIFSDVFHDLGTAPFLDASSESHHLSSNLLYRAGAAFPLSKDRAPKRPYVSASTLDIVVRKNAMRDFFVNANLCM